MSSVNKVILVGHLGANPELRYTADGKAICTMSVATDYLSIDKEQNRQKKVNWHRVVLWGHLAEICKEHLAKGRHVYVEGRVDNRSYTDKEGQRRFSTEVVGHAVVFLDGSAAWREKQTAELAGQEGSNLARYPEESSMATTPEGDDLPF
jgi:single-strand DNA-binding protein